MSLVPLQRLFDRDDPMDEDDDDEIVPVASSQQSGFPPLPFTAQLCLHGPTSF